MKDKNHSKEQILLDILYTSLSTKPKFIGHGLPLESVALTYIELIDKFDEIYANFAKKYDGMEYEQALYDEFANQRKSLTELKSSICTKIRGLCEIKFYPSDEGFISEKRKKMLGKMIRVKTNVMRLST